MTDNCSKPLDMAMNPSSGASINAAGPWDLIKTQKVPEDKRIADRVNVLLALLLWVWVPRRQPTRGGAGGKLKLGHKRRRTIGSGAN